MRNKDYSNFPLVIFCLGVFPDTAGDLHWPDISSQTWVSMRITWKTCWNTVHWAPPQAFWFHGSRVRPEKLHFLQVQVWCWYGRAGKHSLRTIGTENNWDDEVRVESAFPVPSTTDHFTSQSQTTPSKVVTWNGLHLCHPQHTYRYCSLIIYDRACYTPNNWKAALDLELWKQRTWILIQTCP